MSSISCFVLYSFPKKLYNLCNFFWAFRLRISRFMQNVFKNSFPQEIINLEPVTLYMELASDNFFPYLVIQIYWWAISCASLLLAIQVSWDPSVTLQTQLLNLIICSNFLSLVNFTTATFTPFKVFSDVP